MELKKKPIAKRLIKRMSSVFREHVSLTNSTWTNSPQVGAEHVSGDIIRGNTFDDEKLGFYVAFQGVYGINCTLYGLLIHRQAKLGISMHD